MSDARKICIPVLIAWISLAIWTGFPGSADSWIPTRWPGGPLELERRALDKTLPTDPALQETTRRWYDPATLDLLAGTPVNCLLVTWAGGSSAVEQQQQQIVTVYARQARTRGLAVLGLIRPGGAPASLVTPAVEAGLDGLVIEGDLPGSEGYFSEVRQALRARNSPAAVIPLAAWEKLTPAPDIPIFAVADAVMPGLREFAEAVDASPSSEPWIDSNLWLLQCYCAQESPKTHRTAYPFL